MCVRARSEASLRCRAVELASYEAIFIPDAILDAVTTPTAILKPNISTRSPHSYTHPAVVRALGEALRRRGVEVIIGEGMHLTHFKQAVLRSTGYDALVAEYPFIDFEKEPCVAVPTGHPALPEVAVPQVILRPDVTVVNVPKLKTHLMTFYTGPIKNISMGVVNQHSRAAMHRLAGNDFRLLGELLVAACLALEERVALTVVDAGFIMEGDGPTFGQGRWLGKLLCGPTAEVEWLCACLLGAERTPVPVALAPHRPPASGDPLGAVGLAPLDVRPPATYQRSLLARLPAWTNMDYWASVILGRIFIGRTWSRVRIDPSRCSGCRTCVAHCPSGAITVTPAGLPHVSRKGGETPPLPVVDDRLCTRCLSCVENCPQEAINPQYGPLMRLLNRIGGYVY
jgi:uncharacterized protein (DUF362 family)/ferredoxin